MDGELVSVEKLVSVLSLIKTRNLKRYDDYYRGKQPLAFLSPEARAEVGDRIPELVLNVPRIVVGSLEERMDVEGFALSRNEQATDESLMDIWQANELDESSHLCHIEALKHGIAFVTVWPGAKKGDMPRIAVESAHQMAVEWEPGSRKIVAAAKVWRDAVENGTTIERAELYTPASVTRYRRPVAGSSFATWLGSGWVQDGPAIANPFGEVPVVAFVNRPSLTDLSGESELRDVMTLTDGVNKLLSDMMVTSEHHAEPRRYATGMQIPREAAGSERLRAEAKKQWDEATRGKTWLGGKDVNFGQFAQADLVNFKTGVDLILSKVAFITGLAPHMLGITTENPASAEAIRSSEAPLIRRVQRKMRTFGGSWERVMLLALKARDGAVPADSLSLEVRWASPETRTFAQDADAVMKLVGGDRPVITVAAGRETLGFSPTQIKRMQDEEREAAATAATADAEARMAQARRLVESDGLTLNAAMAAVGLLQAAAANSTTPPTATGAASAG